MCGEELVPVMTGEGNIRLECPNGCSEVESTNDCLDVTHAWAWEEGGYVL